jgi:hypothetical protein
MAQFKDEWLEHQRRRFMRPDTHRWMRPDAAKSQGATEAPDANFDAEFHDRRLKVATLRVEWELLKFALRGRKAGFNPTQPRDDHGRWTNGGDSNSGQAANADDDESRVIEVSAKKNVPSIVKEFGKWTARQYVSKYCQGSVNRELPGEFQDMTIADIWNIAKGGDARARTCLKLMRPRFGK